MNIQLNRSQGNKFEDGNEAAPMSPLPGGSPGVPATQIVPDVWPVVPVIEIDITSYF